MADYSYTAGNVSLVSGLATAGMLAEAAIAGNVLYFDSDEQKWYLAGHDAPVADRYALALVSGSAEQTIAICEQVGAIVDFGDFVIDEGDLIVASSGSDGAIAPYADLDVPGGDSLLIVGFGTTTRQVSLLLNRTGVTAMPTIEGNLDSILASVTLIATGTVLMSGSADITLGDITTTATGTVV
jgi:hypothetical protein